MLKPQAVPPEFEAETRRLVLTRLRVVLVLALVLTPAFIPLDYVRLPEHFGAVVALRLAACVVMLGIVPLTMRREAPRHAIVLSAVTIATIAGYLAGTARLTDGAHDPVYLHQSMALIFVIMGVGLLFPLDGYRIFALAGIPVVLQVLMTLDFDLVANLPMLTLSLMALIIATVGANSTFATRLGDYEGRTAKEALLRARSDFVAMLTHDIKDPLAAVRGYVSMLREDEDFPERQRDVLGRIESSTQKALLLATNFLDVSMIEAGSYAPRIRPVDVKELLRRTLGDARSQADAKGIELEIESEEVLPAIEADAGLLGRVFANILANAIRFTPNRGTVRTIARRSGADHLEVLVEDTGQGIAPEALERIFQRFSRDPGRSDSTGLGLYIVRTFVEAHGGAVSAANREDGPGTRVRLRLPIRSPGSEALRSVTVEESR